MTDGEQGQHGCVSVKAQAEFFLACLHFGASLCTAGPAFSSSFGIPAGSLYSTKKVISKKKIHAHMTVPFHIAPVFGHHHDLTTKQTTEQLFCCSMCENRGYLRVTAAAVSLGMQVCPGTFWNK